MQMSEFISQRLTNQHLIGQPAPSVADLVAWQGAVQSQDVAGANWTLGQRLTGVSEVDITAAFDRGEILRTHVLRPTWHYVTPADLHWLRAATAHRVQRLIAFQKRQHNLTADQLERYGQMIVDALQRHHALTRAELFTIFAEAAMPAEGVRGAHVLMHAELECLIASGPLKGRQHTYMLLAERAPATPPVTRNEALARLTLRYVQSHGPATNRDLAWWSSLTLTEATRAIELAGSALASFNLDGTLWYSAAHSSPPHGGVEPRVHLLPNYDEYFSRDGRLDQGDGPPAALAPALHTAGRFDRHHIVVGGRLRGGWNRRLTINRVTVELDPFVQFTPEQRAATEHAAERYANFLNRDLNLVWRT
jgi:hypothetical protein